MIRVIVDGQIYERHACGGIARYWTETIRALNGLHVPVRHEVVVAKDAGRLGELRFLRSKSFRAVLASWRADLFHSTYYTTWPRLKKPSVVTVYDLIDAEFPLLQPNGKSFVNRQIETIRKADAVIAISRSTRDLTRKWAGVENSKLFVAAPAVAPPFAAAPPERWESAAFRQRLTGGAPYLLHVGRRGNYKNAATILKAFGLAASQTDRHLLLLGGAPALKPEESAVIVAARVAERVHLMSPVSDDQLRLAYAGADAYVSASLMEGFGIPIVEALACGTGLILSDIPVYREIAQDRAVFVEPANAEDWAQAMTTAIRVSPVWREEVLNQYTWEQAALVHVAAYERAMER